MTVVLTLSSSEEWGSLVERSMIPSVDNIIELDTIDTSVLVKNSVSIEEVHNTLSLYDSVILVYPAIQTILSEELRAGTNCELAISKASNYVDKILATHRLARKKLKMLNMRSLNCATSEKLTLLSEMGWNLDNKPLEAEDDIYTLAAYQIVHQNKKLKKLTELLTASSIPFGSASEEVKIDITLGKYDLKLREFETRLEAAEKSKNALLETQQKMGKVEEKLLSVEAEGELFRLQATQQQEEIEKYFYLCNKLENEKNLASKREKDLQDNEKILGDLNGLQVEKIAELESLLNDKNKTLGQLEGQLNEELVNLERVYDELDTTKTLFGNTEALLIDANVRIDELNTEIELLKAHLSVVQDELEMYFIKSTEAEEQRSEAQKEISLLEKQSESTKREYVALKDKFKELEEERRLQHDEHNHETKRLREEYLTLELKFNKSEEDGRLQHDENIRETKKLQREYSKLELRFNKVEEARRSQNSEHIRETKQIQREYLKLERKFKQQRGELASRIHQVERLTSELESIKSSGSWKIGAPVRAVGKALGKVDRKKNKLRQDKGLLYTSELFDANWYLNTYPDVKEANIDPAEHYLEYGAREGRLPSASFDGNWYLKRYPDVADTDMNPLVHYLKFGQNEGRSASPALLENFKG